MTAVARPKHRRDALRRAPERTPPEHLPSIDAELRRQFIEGMSLAACTVNVVTTDGPAGRFGLTVSAMSTVSADAEKPMLLICVNRDSAAAAPILQNGVFCVNVLRDDQSYISESFAGRNATTRTNKFACAQWMTQTTGAPRVADSLVAFDCRLVSSQVVGTHYVCIGAVLDVHIQARGSPLIYANRGYGTLSQPHYRSAAAARGEVLRLGAFHTFAPCVVPGIIERFTADGRSIDLQLLEGDQKRISDALKFGTIDLALAYEWDLGPEITNEKLVGLQPYVLLSAAHPLAAHATLTLAQLAHEPMILLDAVPSGDFFVRLFTERGLTPVVRFRTGSFEMVRGMVGRGLGYSILVTRTTSNVTYDGRTLTTRPLADEMPTRYIALASRRGGTLPRVAVDFADACRRIFSGSGPATDVATE
jgi:flavin reductase (DIM6/NTAB) family NADH-FMN oxidoreductase RutF/DNA-binding transcriptional LysR family regulator